LAAILYRKKDQPKNGLNAFCVSLFAKNAAVGFSGKPKCYYTVGYKPIILWLDELSQISPKFAQKTGVT